MESDVDEGQWNCEVEIETRFVVVIFIWDP
jgi:hypothetical protein